MLFIAIIALISIIQPIFEGGPSYCFNFPITMNKRVRSLEQSLSNTLHPTLHPVSSDSPDIDLLPFCSLLKVARREKESGTTWGDQLEAKNVVGVSLKGHNTLIKGWQEEQRERIATKKGRKEVGWRLANEVVIEHQSKSRRGSIKIRKSIH